MALFVGQETFNNAVRENIEDLGMSKEEAVKEAVEQFKAQGADLSQVIKDLMITSPDANIKDIVNKLKHNFKNKSSETKKTLIEQLEQFRVECDKGISVKVEAGKCGGYDVLLDILVAYKGDYQLEKGCLKGLIALMSKQPDLLDQRAVGIIFPYLAKSAEFDTKRLSLKWIRECCIMHEMNRQMLMNSHITDKLKDLLTDSSPDVLRDVLLLCRALVLDDDVRVEFGKAHEHARIIASETLCVLTGLLQRFIHDENLINELMLTLCSILVRTEFCKKVEDAGGLNMVKDTLIAFKDSEKVSKSCFKLIKTLAGNDDCKTHMIDNRLAEPVITVLIANQKRVHSAYAGLSAIAALSLRSPKNSQALFNAGAPAAIIEVMKLHPDEKQIQKAGSWAIRNMVSRSRDQNPTFLQLGAEQLLQAAMGKFKDIEYDLKAALRDLGCKVQLKEEWTGKGGVLN